MPINKKDLIPPPPPIPKIPTTHRLGFFFARSPSVGAVSGPCLASAAPAKSAFLPPTDASLFSVFSGGHAIVPKVISFANAGLEAVVCG